MRRRARARARQGGFTLVELLVGIMLAAVFGAALYGFLFSSMNAAQTEESQATTQQQARDALAVMANDVRQASSPNPGVTRGIESYSPTGFVVYVDNGRAVDPSAAINPRPQRVRYTIAAGTLTREVSRPVGSAPPFTYGTYGPAVVMATGVQSGTPLFAALDRSRTALPATASGPAVGDIGLVTLTVRIQYRNGNTTPTAEYSTDVAPRNPLT
ncbi:MAG: prepilin-type N-terminal cleavage/methylation domain-containing protein [Thermoleophilia bacterium]|nr:prepilin-type N-terminal cleavage/methylation domain-containing protein [Thermoleophilia bacterium]